MTYRDILKTTIREDLADITHIIELKNGITEICICDYKNDYMYLYIDEKNKAFDIPEVMTNTFDCNLMLDIIKIMLRWKFEYIDNL